MVIFFRCTTIFFLLFSFLNAYPQNTDTTIKENYDIYKIKFKCNIGFNSDSITIKDFIWNDKRNLAEVLNDKNGYLINYLSYGGRNVINYNSFNENSIGIFKDGIQRNDIIFGGYDIENISINEIDQIEEISSVMSFLYGINARGKSLNIISKDYFLPYIFTQLRYTQDRFGALGADVNIIIPFSKKINYTFGVSSNVSEGRYTNNHLNIWRARSRINFFSSKKLNFKIDFDYSKFERGLFEGLYNSTDDTLSSYILAKVINSESYEKVYNYYFNVQLKANLLNDVNKLSELNLYTINSLREYNDLENSQTPNGINIYNAFKYIRYGINLKQNLGINITKDIKANLFIGGDAFFDLYHYNVINTDTSIKFDPASNLNIMTLNHYSVYSRVDIDLSNFYISTGIREDYFENKFHTQYGIEGGIKFIINNYNLTLFSGVNSTIKGLNLNKIKYFTIYSSESYYLDDNSTYIEMGLKFHSDKFKINLKQFANDNSGKLDFINGNYSLEYLSQYFDGKLYIDKFSFEYYPDIFIKSELCYHNFFFDDKLNLKTGIIIKYASKYNIPYYSQYRYEIIPNTIKNERDFFNIDFYIGARIGSANVTFTFANLLNHLNYTASVFPYDDRGGLFNSLARFSIVWDFKY